MQMVTRAVLVGSTALFILNVRGQFWRSMLECKSQASLQFLPAVGTLCWEGNALLEISAWRVFLITTPISARLAGWHCLFLNAPLCSAAIRAVVQMVRMVKD